MTVLKAVWLVGVSVGAVGLAGVLMGSDGTAGALLGVGLGLVLCIVNHFVTRGVSSKGTKDAEEPNVKLVMVGVIVSFWLLISFVLLVNYLVPPLVKPAALTALAVYLAYRGAEVLVLSRSSGGRSSGDGPSGGRSSGDGPSGSSVGIVSPGARLSLSALSGTTETESGKETR